MHGDPELWLPLGGSEMHDQGASLLTIRVLSDVQLSRAPTQPTPVQHPPT
jgi:hypothetical protein